MTRLPSRLLLALLPPLVVACAAGTSKAGACGDVKLTHVTGLVNPHVQSCADPACGNSTNPPVGGPHCPTPLACGTYSTPQPKCAWIHNLEHGHLVLLYDCPNGCPDVVAGLQHIADGVAEGSNGVRRVVVTPDPDLGKKVAAVVWGWSWTGDSVDAHAIGCLASHDEQDAPEPGLDCAGP